MVDRLDALESVGAEARATLGFLVYAHRLSGVERFVTLTDGSRQENSAEHSWHLSLCATVFAPTLAPDVDLQRVLQMIAVHDLVEIEVGDVPSHESAARAAIADAERAAARDVFGRLPDGERLLALWEEFEAAHTEAARFARAVDRLAPMLLHWAGGGRAWRAAGVRREQLDQQVDVVASFWPPLAPLARAIIADAAARGDFGEAQLDSAPSGGVTG